MSNSNISLSSDSARSITEKDLHLRHSEDHEVAKIQTCGDNEEYIIIGGHKYMRHELMKAMAGTLNPGLAPYPKHQFGNAAPLGLCGFAMCVFVLSVMNVRLDSPSNSLTLCIFYGGAIQFLAGCWGMVTDNTFAATAFVSFGCFWITYGVMGIPAFNTAVAYDDPVMLGNAVGFYLIGWGIFCFMICIVSMKSTLTLLVMFIATDATFLLLAGANMNPTYAAGLTRAGGVTGLIAGILAFYNAFEGVANRTNSYFVPKPLPLTEKWW